MESGYSLFNHKLYLERFNARIASLLIHFTQKPTKNLACLIRTKTTSINYLPKLPIIGA